MEEVIHYLELKNQYYEKFYTITSKFLDQIIRDDWKGLDLVVDNRERILNILRSFDMKIAELFDRLDVQQTQVDLYRSRVKSLMDKRTEWVNKIVRLDLDLIAKIEDVKTDTIRELRRTVETGQQLHSFEENSGPPKLGKPVKEI